MAAHNIEPAILSYIRLVMQRVLEPDAVRTAKRVVCVRARVYVCLCVCAAGMNEV